MNLESKVMAPKPLVESNEAQKGLSERENSSLHGVRGKVGYTPDRLGGHTHTDTFIVSQTLTGNGHKVPKQGRGQFKIPDVSVLLDTSKRTACVGFVKRHRGLIPASACQIQNTPPSQAPTADIQRSSGILNNSCHIPFTEVAPLLVRRPRKCELCKFKTGLFRAVSQT